MRVDAGLTGALCILGAGDRRRVDARLGGEERVAGDAVRHRHPPAPCRGVRRRRQPCGRDVCARVSPTSRPCAIGEIGLDYHYDFSPRAAQHEVFRAQVAIARELRLPVVIHTREATDDTFAILREEGAGTCAACSTASPATRRWRGRRSTWVLPVVRRDRDVSAVGGAARRRQDHAGRPAAGRNRRARISLPCRTAASATSRRTSSRVYGELAARPRRWCRRTGEANQSELSRAVLLRREIS